MGRRYRWSTMQRIVLPELPEIELAEYEKKDGQPKGGFVALSPTGKYLAFWARCHHQFWENRGGEYAPLQPAVPSFLWISPTHGRDESEFIVGTVDELLGVGFVSLRDDTFFSIDSFLTATEFANDIHVSPNGKWCACRFFDKYAVTTLSKPELDRMSYSAGAFALSNQHYATQVEVCQTPNGVTFDWPEDKPSDVQPTTILTTLHRALRIHSVESGDVVRRVPNTCHDTNCWFASDEHLVFTEYESQTAETGLLHRINLRTGDTESISCPHISTAVALTSSVLVAGTESGELVVCDFHSQLAIPVETEFQIRDRMISVSADRNHNIVFCSRDGIAAVGRIVGL